MSRLLEIGILVLGAIFAMAYAYAKIRTSLRLGEDEVETRVLDLTRQANEELERRVARVERERDDMVSELKEALGKKDEKINHLEGMVHQLRNEAQGLRGLVMGDKVPPALAAEMKREHDQTRAQQQEAMESFRDAILQGLLAMSQDFREALDEAFNRQEWTGDERRGIDKRIRNRDPEQEMGI